MFLGDADILAALAETLNTSIGALPGYWTGIAAEAHATAYQDILQGLTARGFKAAQISAWDRGPEFERMQSLYWALIRGGALANYDDRYIGRFDRRKELCSVLVSNNGAWQRPGDTPGTVQSGTFDGGNDLFGTPVDPNDDRLGKVVQW